ncbi:hypothetical protein FOA52_002183 [Chlamydomonas sp. UWO 241]|nr:hypothetical protein FOA52_002183 [Chlamydomonas sp. UWO 241]
MQGEGIAEGKPTPLNGVGFRPTCVWDEEVHAYLEGCFGREQFESMSAALCTPPTVTCLRVNTLRASTEEVLAHVRQTIAAAAAAAAAGSGRSGEGHPQAPHGPAPRQPYVHASLPVVMLPGEGPLAVNYSVCGGKEVVISRKTGEAVLRGAPVYAPGLLACSSGVEAGDTVAVSVALERPGCTRPPLTRGTVIGSNAWERAQLGDRRGLFLGMGMTTGSRAQMFHASRGVAVLLTFPAFRVPSAEGLEGKVMLQNLPSVCAAVALSPPPGSRVLDMCAAPGGKTTLLAQLMGDRGEVVALDRSHAKVAEINALADELGLTCVRAMKMDATKAAARPEARAEGGGYGGGARGGGGNNARGGVDGCASAGAAGMDAAAGGVAAAGVGARTEPRAEGGGGARSGVDSGKSVCADMGDEGAGGEAATAAAAGFEAAAAAEAAEAAGAAKRDARGARKAAAAAARGQTATRRDERTRTDAAAAVAAAASAGAAGGGNGVGAGVGEVGFPPCSFDHVLVDAPCSALGLRPRLLQTAGMLFLEQCAAYQRRILAAGVALLRPGGVLVFSTCTMNPGENEANVRWLLDTYPGVLALEAVPSGAALGGPGLVGSHPGRGAGGGSAADGGGAGGEAGAAGGGGDRWFGERWLTEAEAPLVQRFDPRRETIGFFIARFRKAAGGAGDA